jgi:hypothetical protein
MNRSKTFAVAIAYLIVLLLVGLAFFVKRDWLWFLLPQAFSPDHVYTFGSIPVGVPWFGALGAVLISLTGIFEHEHDWDEGLWPWHLARPLIGIALSVVSVLILQAGILAVGATPQAQPTVPKNLLYYLVAFMVGYREETFRELIKRLVDVILAPGDGGAAAPKPAIQQINPAQAPHNTSTQVIITGSGLAGTQSVKFGATAAQIAARSDSQLTIMTPVVQAAGAITVTVTTKGGSATGQFNFT